MLKISSQIAFLLVLMSSCASMDEKTSEKYQNILNANKKFIGARQYQEISDSIDHYFGLLSKHGLHLFVHSDEGNERIYYRSPLISMNTKKNRIGGSIIFEGDKSVYGLYHYFGYKYYNKWYFFIQGGVEIISKEYLGYEDSEQVPKHILIKECNSRLENSVIKKANEKYEPNNSWFEQKLEGSGYHTAQDSMSKKDYKNAPDEFWTKKYHENLFPLRAQLSEKIREELKN